VPDEYRLNGMTARPVLFGVLLLSASLASCSRTHASPDRSAALVLTYTSPMWYEETARYFQVSPDGERAIYGSGPRSRLYELSTGKENDAAWHRSIERPAGGAFASTGSLVRLGGQGADAGWYTVDRDGTATKIDVPTAALPRWAPTGSAYAYFTPGEPSITVRTAASSSKVVQSDGSVTGLVWAPSADALYATVLHPDGLSSLVKISTDGSFVEVRARLDASPFFNSLAFSGDGRRILLALASDNAPDPAVRHNPEAPHRDLDIYSLDLRDGRLQVVVSATGDDCCPYVAAGSLFWTHNNPQPQVVVLARDGGDLHVVADHGFLPRWSPDGKEIAFTRGYYRLADYGLDMDIWVAAVDAAGAVTSRARPWITGFGEDMGAAWSPDGRWVAYHSHRSTTAVPLYESPGRTDDTWLQPASGGRETRVTDFGYEVGPPDWAPDSRHLIFDSWDKDGVPRFANPWIVEIDASGRSHGSKRMPLPPGVKGINGEAWSPKGDEIAFVERIDDRARALWVSHSDGRDPRRLTEFSSYTIGGVAWTPDGRDILYGALADDRMQIFSIPRSGGSARQLTRGDVNLMHPSVAPDGRIAASRIPWHKELWRMPL
jgi:Tol biopolymer transport system component